MRQPHVDDFVRLTRDIPELSLNRGEVGVVRSTWFAPATAYEVEFHPSGLTHERRALLLAECLEIDEPRQSSVEEFSEFFEPEHVLG
jgi:hypothetical protein